MDRAWEVINELRETWCNAPCNYREGCGCADAIQEALKQERIRCGQIASAAGDEALAGAIVHLEV